MFVGSLLLPINTFGCLEERHLLHAPCALVVLFRLSCQVCKCCDANRDVGAVWVKIFAYVAEVVPESDANFWVNANNSILFSLLVEWGRGVVLGEKESSPTVSERPRFKSSCSTSSSLLLSLQCCIIFCTIRIISISSAENNFVPERPPKDIKTFVILDPYLHLTFI